ncbi:MAG: anthranilate phosphoribosyltransferase [Candidatus Methanomethylophilaceae archaeon]|nr:anthranilate phosphoribosyltransferase [Candidatus Methanomethylophilaceae archaeon]
MIESAIMKIVDKQDLTYDEAYGVMNEIMTGVTSPVQNAAYLAALSTKSTKAETKDEIAGSAAAMRDHARRVDCPFDTLEIVGTGGDGSNSFNISTTASLVIAASGVKVSKHGNRAASSRSGSADVLEALGVSLHQNPSKALALLEDVGICFLFAQDYHTSMRYVGTIRKELGIRTVFNILGPLTNPAYPKYEVLGVYDPALLEPLAHVLTDLGVRRGMVVHGDDRLDEISISGTTSVCEFRGGSTDSYKIGPEDFGMSTAKKTDIVGGTAEENARITLSVLGGEKGPRRDVVLLNAAAGLYVAGKVGSMADGIELSAQTIDDGKASDLLERYRVGSNA